MNAGVRNQLTGTVSDIQSGEVMSQVTIKVGDNEICSVMTTSSVQQAGFQVGDQATALVKAASVVLVK